MPPAGALGATVAPSTSVPLSPLPTIGRGITPFAATIGRGEAGRQIGVYGRAAVRALRVGLKLGGGALVPLGNPGGGVRARERHLASRQGGKTLELALIRGPAGRATAQRVRGNTLSPTQRVTFNEGGKRGKGGLRGARGHFPHEGILIVC